MTTMDATQYQDSTDPNNNLKSYSLRPRTSRIKNRAEEDTGNAPLPDPEPEVWRASRTKRKQKTKSMPLSKYRRKTANARERSRMREINDAFESLRRVIPQMSSRDSRDCGNEKLTKITTLRLAMKYISALNCALTDQELESDGESLFSDYTLTPPDFRELSVTSPVTDFREFSKNSPSAEFREFLKTSPVVDFREFSKTSPAADFQEFSKTSQVANFRELPMIPTVTEFRELPSTSPVTDLRELSTSSLATNGVVSDHSPLSSDIFSPLLPANLAPSLGEPPFLYPDTQTPLGITTPDSVDVFNNSSYMFDDAPFMTDFS